MAYWLEELGGHQDVWALQALQAKQQRFMQYRVQPYQHPALLDSPLGRQDG